MIVVRFDGTKSQEKDEVVAIIERALIAEGLIAIVFGPGTSEMLIDAQKNEGVDVVIVND